MGNSDPVVQILLEAAARGRELRRQREAQKETPINVSLSQGSTLTGAGDSGTLNAPADDVSIAQRSGVQDGA